MYPPAFSARVNFACYNTVYPRAAVGLSGSVSSPLDRDDDEDDDDDGHDEDVRTKEIGHTRTVAR